MLIPTPAQHLLSPTSGQSVGNPHYQLYHAAYPPRDLEGHLAFDSQATSTTQDALSTSKQHGTLSARTEQKIC